MIKTDADLYKNIKMTSEIAKNRFKTVSSEERDKIALKSKAVDTNKAMKLWVNYLEKYLIEKDC